MERGRVVADRYEILQPIAEGASSVVWEARDAVSGDTVAVKAVSLERAGWRAEVRDRFQQEARLLQLVKNEYLVGVRDIGETDDGFLYLVLDRLSGETLADRIGRAPRLSWREASAVALELARGLSALHAEGIVHRDLKPANVILHDAGGTAPPRCKIIDLGISKALAAAADPVLFATLTATGQVLGTPEYMSHEQALGERDVDARTDVWALGVVLYEMLAGRRPFEGQNPNAVLAAIRRGSPPRLAEIARDAPPALAEVVDRCMARARADRYRDGHELAAALSAAIARGAAEAERKALRRRLFIAAGVVLTAATIALAARALGSSSTAPKGSAELPPPAPPSASSSAAAPTPSVAPPPTATPTASATAATTVAPSPPSSAPWPSSAPSSAPSGAPAKAKPVTGVNSAGF
ncbi:serine/threonine protein kinase [Minicystis rosea]|nr:serine/threonine protein kinase [Minicystis rosea]